MKPFLCALIAQFPFTFFHFHCSCLELFFPRVWCGWWSITEWCLNLYPRNSTVRKSVAFWQRESDNYQLYQF